MRKALNTLSPAGKKWISTYNTTHRLTDITRCERVWVCERRGWGLGGKGKSGTARSLNRSDQKIVKYPPPPPPLHELRKKEKVMVNYQPAEEGPCGENLKILPSNGDLNSKNLPVGK